VRGETDAAKAHMPMHQCLATPLVSVAHLRSANAVRNAPDRAPVTPRRNMCCRVHARLVAGGGAAPAVVTAAAAGRQLQPHAAGRSRRSAVITSACTSRYCRMRRRPSFAANTNFL
jgi:hypothetical protein